MIGPLTTDCVKNTPERHYATLSLMVACDSLDLLPEHFIDPDDLANALRYYAEVAGCLQAAQRRQGIEVAS